MSSTSTRKEKFGGPTPLAQQLAHFIKIDQIGKKWVKNFKVKVGALPHTLS